MPSIASFPSHLIILSLQNMQSSQILSPHGLEVFWSFSTQGFISFIRIYVDAKWNEVVLSALVKQWIYIVTLYLGHSSPSAPCSNFFLGRSIIWNGVMCMSNILELQGNRSPPLESVILELIPLLATMILIWVYLEALFLAYSEPALLVLILFYSHWLLWESVSECTFKPAKLSLVSVRL